jgi:hypothetical protein
VHVVADDRAVLGVPDEDAEQVVEGLVADNCRVRVGRIADVDPGLVGVGSAVEQELRPGRAERRDPVLLVVLGDVPWKVVLCPPTTTMPSLKPRTVKPFTVTFWISWFTSPVSKSTSPRMQMPLTSSGAVGSVQAFTSGVAAGSRTAPIPRRVIPSVVIATFSRWTPLTTIVSPGCATSIAAWIESPGPTTVVAACADPAETPAASIIATASATSSLAART